MIAVAVGLINVLELRLDSFEMIFIRVLHLLAHHPDFAVTEESLPDIAK
jgi:sister chromatid cohesion protein PDS5